MAGTITVDTVSNGAGTKTISSSNLVDGSAKAWVNFNGTGTVAINASFNVLSITDNAVGDYTVNFTNALTDANYSWTFGCTRAQPLGTGSCAVAQAYNNAIPTTTTLRFQTRETNPTSEANADQLGVSITIFR